MWSITMNKNTKDTIDISFVALMMILVGLSITACGILIATPFLIKWIVGLLLIV